MIAIERVMDAIARELGLDPLDVRKANLLRRRRATRTPYEQKVEDIETLRGIVDDLETLVRLPRAPRGGSRPSMRRARSSSAASR